MWGPDYNKYSQKYITNTSATLKQQTNLTKHQSQPATKSSQANQIDQFTKQDEIYLQYLIDRYINRNQTKISPVGNWQFKDQKDFRNKIYTLITEIGKQNQNLFKERDLYFQKNKKLSQFLSVLFKEMNTKDFYRTKLILQSRDLQKFSEIYQYQAKKFCEQLRKLEEMKPKLDQMTTLQNKLSIFSAIIQSLDSHKSLVELVNYHKNQQSNVLDRKTLQKLIGLTKKLDEDQRTLQQQKQLLKLYAPNRWLSHFLALLIQNFDEKKIESLQKSVNQLKNNDDSAKISMNAIKIHCLKKNKQSKFMEKLKKMKIQDQYSVEQAIKFVKNTLELQLKRKFEEIFQKELAWKIIESQNSKGFEKLRTTYVKQVCNSYFIKMKSKGYQVPQQQLTNQKEDFSVFINISQKLNEIEQILGSKQTSYGNQKIITQNKENAIGFIWDSIQRISIFLKNENRNLKKASQTLNSSRLSSNKYSEQGKNKNQLFEEKGINSQIFQKILNQKKGIEKSLKEFGQKVKESNYCRVLNYEIGSIHFNEFIDIVTKKIDKIQSIIKPLNSTKLTTFKLFNQSCSKTNLNKTQTQKKSKDISNNEDMNAQMRYLENNLQEINKLKAQINTMTERIQQLQNQNAELDKLKKQKLQLNQKLKEVENYNMGWQQVWQKQNNQIKKLKELINQKEKNQIDLRYQMENKQKLNNSSNISVNKLKDNIIQKQKQITILKDQYSQLQQESNHQISLLRVSINQKQQEIQSLKAQVFRLESEIIQKDNLLTQKDSSIKQLQEKNKNQLRISQNQIIFIKNDSKLNRNSSILNKKEQTLKEKEYQQKRNTNSFQICIKQPQQQSRKLQQPKKVPKFKSFNTNEPRDKSAMKKPESPKKKNQMSTLKQQQKREDVLSTENITKKQNNNSLKINKDDPRSTMELLNQKPVAQTSISGKNLKQNNQKLIEQDSATLMRNNTISKQEVIELKQKFQEQKKQLELQYSSQLNGKQEKIRQLQNQLSTINQKSQKFQNQIQFLTNQVKTYEEEIAELTQSIQHLRQKFKAVPILQAELQTLKQQKQNFQIKLQYATLQLQKHKNAKSQTAKHNNSSQFDEIKRLQEIVADKNIQIEQRNEIIQQISKQLADSKDEKAKIVAQLENFQKEKQKYFVQSSNNQKEKDITSALQEANKDLERQLSIIKKELDERNEKVKRYEEELKAKPMSDQLKLKEEMIKKLEEEKKKMKTDKLTLELDLDQKTQHYNELRQKYKKQTTTLKNKIQQLTSSTPGFQSEISTLKNEMKSKEQALKLKEKEIESLQNKLSEFQDSLKKNKQDANMHQQQIKQLQKQKELNKKHIQRLYEQKNQIESENESLNNKLRLEIKRNKEQTQRMKKDQQLQIKNLKLENARQLEEIRKQIKSAEFAQRIKSTTDTANQSSALLKLQHEKLKREYQALQKTKLHLQQLINQLEVQVKQLKIELNDKSKKLKQADENVKFMQDSQKKLQKSLVPYQGGIKKITTIIYDRYFQNQALDQQPYKKYLLYDLIQQKTKRVIKKTKLIYTIDLLNKVNFHNYIDGKQNLLAVIKTTKGSIFGAFSTSKLERYFKQPSSTVSFIYTFDTDTSIEHFNIDTKKPLNVKSFDWDQFFFIFGNAEVRWRFGEKRIHSSFGISNAYYETKGKDVSILLREGNTREVPIDELEFYQVEFEK